MFKTKAAAQTLSYDYTTESEKCVRFLEQFRDPADSTFRYRDQLQRIANRAQRTLVVSLSDVLDFEGDEEFVAHIEGNALRYVEMFASAVDQLLPAPTVEIEHEDVLDVLMSHRVENQRDADPDDPAPAEMRYPKELIRRYELLIVPGAGSKPLAVREVTARMVGRLVKVRGIVTRVTEVKPLMTVATYTCDICGSELYQEVTKASFSPIVECKNEGCKSRPFSVNLVTRGSKFVRFQELKLQEMADQVPVGNIPRSLTVNLRGDLTRTCSAGEIVTLSGIFLVRPFAGRKAFKAGLIGDVYLLASEVEKAKRQYGDLELTNEQLAQLEEAKDSEDLYGRMARSIAPEIFGHDDIKRALLLQLVGGVTKKLPDSMKIRGDINICLMGDPGVAKSQLLKQVATIAPRGIYTTGKGSSGVGLTAAVLRDPLTNDLVLEGGALVLADLGICCIDEFDKMEDADRSAIHEAMEQQTVSIAKAGITTTLNARASVLAAANPAYGRYNTRKSAAENINLPASLLSRFDLLFLILDKANYDNDFRLAKHIAHVHLHLRHPEIENQDTTYDATFMRAVIAAARKINPSVPRELSEFITNEYVRIRSEEANNTDSQMYTSARTLLAILRLSQALARIRFSDVVTEMDVQEAIRLMSVSKLSLDDDDEPRARGQDHKTAIYTIIRDFAMSRQDRTVQLDEVTRRVLAKGFKESQLSETILEYERLNVWQINSQNTRLRLVA